MLIDKNLFTDEDRAIINSYIAVVDGISALIGEHCEIVLHSFENVEHSAICIANGHNTHRKIGSPITDLALKSLHNMDKNPISQPYFTKSKGAGLMKSVTIAINNKDRIIGLLCININLDVPIYQFVQSLVPQKSLKNTSLVNFANSVEDLVTNIIEQTVEDISSNIQVANNDKNKQIVSLLFEKGIFDIKDSINLVADRLNISRHTVYLYIRQIKQDQEELK